MRQVLVYIPLPEIPLYVSVMALLAAIILGRIFKLGTNYYTAVVGIVVAAIVAKLVSASVPRVPIYGYGAMLFLAFVGALWLGAQLGVRVGIAPQHVQDLAIWLLVAGLAGARITYMIQYQVPLWKFFFLWEGGLVFYGSAIGGVVGYLLAYRFILRKHNITGWKMADVIAPAAALGLCLGRVGCLLNGCCYGNVACPNCPGLSFPLSGQPHVEMVRRGYETAAGFTLDAKQPRRIGAVESNSLAARAGLRPGDDILRESDWLDATNELTLDVKHQDGRVEEINISPRSIPLHPTQIYESISMGLLVFLLLAYYPLKKRDGSVMVLFMLAYAVHRFLNEMLRTDTADVFLGMTLSENISIVVFLAGAALGFWLWLRPPLENRSAVAVTPEFG